jgi:hypothetical protein
MRRTAALLAAALAFMAGCGGDDDTDSKAEFIRQADEICADADRVLEPLGERFQRADQQGNFEQAASLLGQLVDEAEVLLAKLRAIAPPEDDQRVVDRYLDSAAHGIDVLRSLVDALEDRDVPRGRALGEELRRSTERSQGLAQGYGFEECSSGD